jgi:hypothetical protein
MLPLHMLRRRPTPATLIALVALFVALGGPAEAARLIDGSKIVKGSITGRQVHDRSLGIAELSGGARRTLAAVPLNGVRSPQIADGQVTSADIADGGVRGGDIAANTVRSQDVLDGTLGAADLGTNSVAGDEIAPNAVRATEIADNSIDGGEVIDGGLQAQDVATFSGATAQIDFGPVGANSCESQDVPAHPNSASQSILDDVIVVSPAPGWPDDVLVRARPKGDDTTFVLIACNVTGAEVPAAATVFRYAAFDT